MPLVATLYYAFEGVYYVVSDYIYYLCLRAKNKNKEYQTYVFNSKMGEDGRSQLLYFMESRGVKGDKRCSVAVVYPFWKRLHNFVKFIDADVKIFYTGENLKRPSKSSASDHLLSVKTLDLALGFELFENDRYLRFPLWLQYMFDFKRLGSEEYIRTRCQELRYPNEGERRVRCALVASHDNNEFSSGDIGVRTHIHQTLSGVVEIDCAGRFMHNDDSLKRDFDDNKVKYLSQYIFNICPENGNSYGYVTEKIFESISAGCIPIYWGSYNTPEADVLNHDAILFFNRENPQMLVEKIKELISDPEKMDEFIRRPRLREGAEEVIIAKFNELESKLRRIVQSK